MRLLFVLPEYPPHQGGGIITFYRNLLPRLAARGHEVRVLVGSGVFASEDSAPVTVEGVRVEALDLARFRRALPEFSRYAGLPGLQRHLAAAWALREQADRGEGFDVVEATDWGLLFLPWATEPGPPVVAQMHGSCGQIDVHDPVAGEEAQGELIRLLEASAASRVDALQSYSEANADFWRDQARAPVAMIPPAWRPLHEPGLIGKRSGRGLVVGRVQRWKGPEVLCEALRRLGDDAPPMDWMGRDTSFGTRAGSTAAHLAAAFPETWNRKVLHLPQQPPEAAARCQAEAAFVVVPSTWDMFNFTAIEAMGVGTPVICSTGAGAAYLIEDGVNGFLFEREDAGSLAEALRRLGAMGETERKALGEAGRETVRTRLDPERIADLRLEAYARVAAVPRRQPAPDDWLRRACAPGSPLPDPLGFLEHLPLKPLARHVARRALAKLRR